LSGSGRHRSVNPLNHSRPLRFPSSAGKQPRACRDTAQAKTARYCLTVWNLHPLLSVSYWRFSPEFWTARSAEALDVSPSPSSHPCSFAIPSPPPQAYRNDEHPTT
jgi:hypothetical protein